MKKYIFLFIGMLYHFVIYAQTGGQSFILNTDHNTSGAETDFIATDYIKLTEGFKFVAGQNNSFRASIDPINSLPLISNHYDNGQQSETPSDIVAAIPGSAGINGIGGATYNIPIQLPAGLANMTPQLAVVYNSHAGDGVLGRGMNLSGLSAINRVGHSPYYDGNFREVSFDNNDAFILDGSRMLLTDASTNTYMPENDNTVKIQGIEAIGDSFKKFIVTYNNGAVAEFGATTDSRIMIEGEKSVLMWRLNKITDANGFYISYTYGRSNENGESWIEKIEYTGNSKTGYEKEPFYEVVFDYYARANQPFAYYGGHRIKQSRLLHTITVNYLADDEPELYHYTFLYQKGLTDNYLSKVQLQNSDEEEINETCISWEAPQTNTEQADPSTVPDNAIKADFNGDGTTDLLYLDNSNSENREWKMELNIDGQFQENSSFNDNISPNKLVDIPDFNGDGKADIVIGNETNFAVFDMNLPTATYSFCNSNGTEFKNTDHLLLYNKKENDNVGKVQINKPSNDMDEVNIFSGDFDGDGRDEIFFFAKYLGIDYSKSPSNAYILKKLILVEFDDAGNKTEEIIPMGIFANYTPNEIKRYEVYDFTGDGIKDLMVLVCGKVYILKYENNQFNHYMDFDVHCFDEWVNEEIDVADLNGDGIFEIVRKKDNFLFDVIYFSDKNGMKTEPMQFGCTDADEEVVNNIFSNYGIEPSTPYRGVRKSLFVDINQDEKQEVLFAYQNRYYFTYNGDAKDDLKAEVNSVEGLYFDDYDDSDPDYIESKMHIRVFNQNGDSYPVEINENYIGLYESFVADFNGDGVFSIYSRNNEKLLTLSDIDKAHIAAVTDGMGNTTSFTYKLITQQGDFYEMCTSDNSDIVPFGGTIKLVETITQTNGLCAPQVKQYSYKGGMRHSTRGFLGFTEIQEVVYTDTDDPNVQKPVATVSKFKFDDTYFFPYLTETTTSGGYSFDTKQALYTFNSKNTTYEPLIDLGNKRYLMRPDVVTNTEYHPGGTSTTVITDNNYNADGILVKQTARYEGTGNETITTYTDHTGGLYVNYLPQTVTTTYKRSNEETEPQTVKITYNSNGTVNTKTIFEGDAKYKVITQYSYNSYGMPVSESVNAAHNFDGTDRRTRTSAVTTYTADLRFTDYVTDQLGVKTYYHYNPKWGALIMEKTGQPPTATDYDAKQTIDNWGKVTQNSTLSNIDEYGSRHYVKSTKLLTWADENDSQKPDNAAYKKTVTTNGVADVSIYYDNTGRELKTITLGTVGHETETLITKKNYYADGKLKFESEPYLTGGTALGNTFEYNKEWGYLEKTIMPNFVTVISSFDDSNNIAYTTTKESDNESAEIYSNSAKYYNAFGEVWKEKDELTDQFVTHNFYPDGKLKMSTPSTSEPTIPLNVNFFYDKHGNQSTLDDPAAGTVTYKYNGFGELLEQTFANGNKQITVYDYLGRVTKVTDYTDGVVTNTTNYTYYPAAGSNIAAYGQLHKATTTAGVQQEYFYDQLGRVTNITETIPGSDLGSYEVFETQTVYDNYGRHSKTIYPTGFATQNHYNSNGDMYLISRADNNETIWELKEQNALGQTDEMLLGNKIVNKEYDDNRRLKKDDYYNFTLDYSFNKKGEIDLRRVVTTSTNEEYFDFDQYGQLTHIELNKEIDLNTPVIDYLPNGNIDKKPGVGNYTYAENNASPYAVTGINNPAEEAFNTYIPATADKRNQIISYNSFNKISHIFEYEEGVSHTLSLVYGADRMRRKTVYNKNGNTYLTKYFIGNYEREDYSRKLDSTAQAYTRHLHYIPTPDGLSAVYITENNETVSDGEMYYLYTDYLGSIHAIADATGNIIQQLSYDAWGRRRNPTNWADYENVATQNGSNTIFAYTPFFIDRGYTAHQHLDDFALINMNGRVYDPVLARFLSPDPYIQLLGVAQNYNRYSYVLNNPLHYNDPSGESLAVAIAIGAIIGGYSGYKIGKEKGAEGINMLGYIAGGAIIGGMSGSAAAGTALMGGGAWLSGATAGAIGGAGFNLMAGDDVMKGALNGAITGMVGGIVGPAIGGLWGAIGGGAASNLTSQLLYNSGDFNNVNWSSVAINGALSGGLYTGMSYASWKFGGGNNIAGVDIKFNHYMTMQADFQRSRFYRHEFGGYLMEDGSVIRTGIKFGQKTTITLPNPPQDGNIIAEYHTHWCKSGIIRYQLKQGGRFVSFKLQQQFAIEEGRDITLYKFKATQYHSTSDLSTTLKSFVINRYDVGYYPGNGGMNNVQGYNDSFYRFFIFPNF